MSVGLGLTFSRHPELLGIFPQGGAALNTAKEKPIEPNCQATLASHTHAKEGNHTHLPSPTNFQESLSTKKQYRYPTHCRHVHSLSCTANLARAVQVKNCHNHGRSMRRMDFCTQHRSQKWCICRVDLLPGNAFKEGLESDTSGTRMTMERVNQFTHSFCLAGQAEARPVQLTTARRAEPELGISA